MRRFTNRNFGIFTLVVLLFLSTSTVGWACSEQEDEHRMDSGGGHEVPTPFQNVNHRFELADGEFYFLDGTVRVLPEFPYNAFFEVDLGVHPFLANYKRTQSPLYLIEGSTFSWLRRLNRPVKLLFQAHGKILMGKSGPEYVITLTPLGE